MDKLKQLFVSSRPISWVNTAYPFLAGYLVVTHQLTAMAVVGAFYFLIPYNLMMYGINDVFDYESDIRNPRKGGIEGAKLKKESHRFMIWSVILVNVPFLVYLLVNGNFHANRVLLLVVFMVLAYSLPKLRFKERPFVDSITSSIHFVGPLIYALALVGWQPSFVPYVLSFFLWGMASHAFGAVQDIQADREAKINSIGTVLGSRTTVWFSLVLYVLSAAVVSSTGLAGVVVGIVALLYAANVARFIKLTDKQCEQANKGWKVFIKLNWLAGFVITILLIVSW